MVLVNLPIHTHTHIHKPYISFIKHNFLIIITINTMEVPEGVIIPPPEVKSIIDKTVQYVIRNGSSVSIKTHPFKIYI